MLRKVHRSADDPLYTLDFPTPEELLDIFVLAPEAPEDPAMKRGHYILLDPLLGRLLTCDIASPEQYAAVLPVVELVLIRFKERKSKHEDALNLKEIRHRLKDTSVALKAATEALKPIVRYIDAYPDRTNLFDPDLVYAAMKKEPDEGNRFLLISYFFPERVAELQSEGVFDDHDKLTEANDPNLLRNPVAGPLSNLGVREIAEFARRMAEVSKVIDFVVRCKSTGGEKQTSLSLYRGRVVWHACHEAWHLMRLFRRKATGGDNSPFHKAVNRLAGGSPGGNRKTIEAYLSALEEYDAATEDMWQAFQSDHLPYHQEWAGLVCTVCEATSNPIFPNDSGEFDISRPEHQMELFAGWLFLMETVVRTGIFTGDEVCLRRPPPALMARWSAAFDELKRGRKAG
ncbi:hypothetical protein F1654_07195 [Alkalicaulis satelles]|uniref:Uncharacterized protein n=1 Tax=Alkalicaulis satelles TaxID=2609175 RepID=A0A5M6ZMR9_9PROT|nr:hypothetical protein [Alkalicaulis satelles]KAA5803581.1 hypothetical protein F1654_07195 [Alkalicaulis satelles]